VRLAAAEQVITVRSAPRERVFAPSCREVRPVRLRWASSTTLANMPAKASTADALSLIPPSCSVSVARLTTRAKG